MPRQVKLKIYENLPARDFYLRYSGVPELDSLLTHITQEELDHALNGWMPPLLKRLGPEPSLCLRKLTTQGKGTCRQQGLCGSYSKQDCTLLAKVPRACFDFDSPQANDIIHAWFGNLFVLVLDTTE